MPTKRIMKLFNNKEYILALVIIVILLCAAGCQDVGTSATTSTVVSSATGTLPVVNTIPGHSINVQDAKNLLDSNSKMVVFIDVRNQSDYDTSYIPGAVLIPVTELPDRLSEVPYNKQVIVYSECR